MRRTLSTVLAALLGATTLVAAPAASAAPPAAMSAWLADELAGSPPDLLPVLVHASGPAHLADAQDAIEAVGMAELVAWDAIGVAVGHGTPAQVEAVRGEPGVTFVEGNQPYEYTLDTSHQATRADIAIDPSFATDANGDRLDGRGGTVAIIDSGVDGLHPMFADPETGESKVIRNLEQVCAITAQEPYPDELINTTCLQDEPSNNTDSNSAGGHGTHVAGIVGGYEVEDSAGRQLRGAAPGAKIAMVSAGGGLAVIGAVNGMNWILANHEDPCAGNPYAGVSYPGSGPECPPIVATNHSYGAIGGGDFDPSSAEVKMQRLLVEEGVTVSWAAGNDGGDGSDDMNNPPSKDPTPGVLSVANYDDANSGTRENALAPSSSRGREGDVSTYPDVAAPGTNITSACLPTLPICSTGLDTQDPFYNTITGTSMASPHIAGYVATLKQADPTLTPGQIEDLLEDTAHKFTSGGAYEADLAARNDDDTTSFDKGHGLVDMAAAVAELIGTDVPVTPSSCPPTGPLVTDAEGDADAFLGVDTNARNEPSLDILEMDITSSPSNDLTFALRVQDLPATPTGYGQYYDMNFTFGGAGYYVQAARDATGAESYALGDFGGDQGTRRTLADLTGSFDADADVVTVVLPHDTIAQAVDGAADITDGSVIGGVNIVSRYELVLVVPDADSASATCPYVVGGEADVTTPTLRIRDLEVDEGDAGTTADAAFTITRDGPTASAVSVDVDTAPGTATPGDDDYEPTPTPTTVTIPAGETEATTVVTVNGDDTVEDDERFSVLLSNPSGAELDDDRATGTIADDDDTSPPTLSISDAAVDEGDKGATAATFAVRLSEPTGETVTVEVATQTDGDDTATADVDYDTVSTTLTFRPGEERKELTVDVRGDTTPEDDETFAAVLSDPSNATIADGDGEGTILDDDQPAITIDDVTVDEDGGPATFMISIDRTSDQDVSVDHLTAAGSARAGDDYEITSGRTVIESGQTSATVDVAIVDDEFAESDETFQLRLSGASHATIDDDRGTATIRDDGDTGEDPNAGGSNGGPDQTTRLAGDDRFETAVAVSKKQFPQDGSASAAIIARGVDPYSPDALVGAPLAAAMHAPLLTITRTDVPSVVRAELRRVLPRGSEVVILGGTDAITARVDRVLGDDLGYEVRRVAGRDRYDTARRVARELGDPGELFLTTGRKFADAMTAGAVAADRGGAILLTAASRPAGPTTAYLSNHGDATATAIGGPAARAYPDLPSVAGRNREDTARKVAQRFLPDAETVALTRADLPYDALAAGAYLGRDLGAPILLTLPDRLDSYLSRYACDRGGTIQAVIALGGPDALSEAVVTRFEDRLAGRGC